MYILLILTLIASSMITWAQVRPSRTWHTDVARTSSMHGVMPTLLGGGEIQRSQGSTGGEQAWQFRTHVQVEPYRFTDSSSGTQLTTTIEAHQELTANPFNDISFNPRAMRWEEFFWFHVGLPDVSLRAGFVHRCKHDIDNLGGADEDNPTSPLLAEQRTIILTGPTVGASLAPVTGAAGTFSAAGGVEYFLNSSDNRRPNIAFTSWHTMRGAIWMRAQHTYPISSSIDILTLAYAAVPWYTSRGGSQEPTPVDARAELFLSAHGRASRMEIGIAAERMFDEVALVYPRSTSFVGLCIRFMPN
ncbi:MAG: hypothetical protein FJ211_07865 [Ignavibacteria bacterium]|nr:hypothetical protein [Ignavibacteria bacterium]